MLPETRNQLIVKPESVDIVSLSAVGTGMGKQMRDRLRNVAVTVSAPVQAALALLGASGVQGLHN